MERFTDIQAVQQNGSVRFRGEDITYLDAERRLRLGITQIPGGRAVFGPVTVIENLRAFGYTLGRDRHKAKLIALCDAMVQSDEFAAAVEAKVVAPLRAAVIEKRNRKSAEAAATRVDFYTLVRGEG